MNHIRAEAYWNESMELLKILEGEGFAARLAGGCVRDHHLGLQPKDIDIATESTPDQTCSIFKQNGYRVVPTGIDHGTVTVIGKFGTFETTTLRSDIQTDGRHATVKFGQSFKEDAERRDFTMNAMFIDRQSQVYDYFSGRKDLAAKRLAFVGTPEDRIKEDYLRILRMYRFWARFQMTPTAQTLGAVDELAAGLRRISQERITGELIGIFTASDPEAAVDHMFASQINLMILPDAKKISSLSWQRTASITTDDYRAMSRLALLLEDIGDTAHLEAIGRRLKLSSKQTEQLCCLVILGGYLSQELSLKNSEYMNLIDLCEKNGTDFFVKCCFPTWSVFQERQQENLDKMLLLEETKQHIRKAKLPISAKEIMEHFQVQPGPQLGEYLERAKILFRDEEFSSKEEGLFLLESEEA